MFSGLIAYRGTVTSAQSLEEGGVTLVVRCEGASLELPQEKDSVAINGVCLTATSVEQDVVRFDVIPETLARSTLGTLRAGDRVNVEYAMRIGDRVGGHFVYGHVDATALLISREHEGQGERVKIERPPSLTPMIAEKAFIAVDGVSLTVAAVGEGWFDVALIPETLARTTLGERKPGSLLNIEVDPLARYVLAVLDATAVRLSRAP
jgi:riboflavin synthase